MNPNTKTKLLDILLADNSQIYLDALKRNLLCCKIVNSVDVCETNTELMTVLQQIEVDVLVIDIIIFGEDFIDGIKKIKSLFPDIKIIVLTILESIYSEEEILKAGVHCYFTKWSDSKKLIKMISTV